MKGYTDYFKKIVPSLRQTTMECVLKNPMTGERILIPLKGREVEVYFHKAADAKRALVFELHGGGFALGDAAKNDRIRALICRECNVNVCGINYRKSPEYPYPAAIEDVEEVLGYFSQHKELFSISNEYILLGYSAGANLATVTAMRNKVHPDYIIRGQILHYPFLDAHTSASQKMAHHTDLPVELMSAFNEMYAPAAMRTHPFISPVYADHKALEGMADACIITADWDGLKEEGIHYGALLQEAEVGVTMWNIPYAHHGYVEDYYNEACFDMIPEDTKSSYHEAFGQGAVKAMAITMEAIEGFTKENV